MENKRRHLVLNILAVIITITMYYMSFIFIRPFYNIRNPLNVGQFRGLGGHLIIIFILVLLVIFTIIFLIYIKVDNEELEVFDQIGAPQYYKKDNLLSLNRMFQYFALISAYILLMRDGYRSITFDYLTQAAYIFKTDLMLVIWDSIFVLFLGLTVTLIIEYINKRKTISN